METGGHHLDQALSLECIGLVLKCRWVILSILLDSSEPYFL